MPQSIALHERGDGGSPPALPAHTGVARPLHDASGNAAQATDSHPHLRGVEGDPTRLSGSRPGGPLWRRYRGRHLYTLTLTDIATGWTECLPLLHRSQEAVVAALQRARKLFPFPLLGIP